MKFFAIVAASLFGATLWAGEGAGEVIRTISADGEVAAKDFSADYCSPCKWIALGSNTAYKVRCQVQYDDMLYPNPSEEDEIKKAENIGKFVNLGIEKFLQEICNDMTDRERAAYYRNGVIQACVEYDFCSWLDMYIDTLNRNEIVVDVEIRAVRLRPVGAFAEAVAQ